MACCIFMRLSLVAKRRLLVLILAIGAVLAVVLAVTRFDPIATTGGAPVSLLNSPDLATVGADKSAPFYNPKPVAEYTLPGTVRRVEDVAGAPPGIKVQRMVYVSQTAAGEAKEVSALFAVKDGAPPPPNGRPLITVAHGTSGVAPGCGISKEPFRLGSNGYFWWYFYTEPLVRAGYAVVMSDYGNLGTPGVSDYIVKNGAGADVLNAARAALKLDVRDIDANKVAIVGHSQGGYNALAAAQMAPSYAPELPIKGTVSQAPGLFPPAPLMKVFLQMGPGAGPDGTADFAAHLADAVVSWSANYPNEIKPSDVLTEKGVQALKTAETNCIVETRAPFDGPYQDFVKPDITANIAGIVSKNMPVYDKFAAPVLMQQGLKDTVVVPGVNIAAYRTFCAEGSTVKLEEYPNDVHSSVLLAGWPSTLEWLDGRFSGKPAPSTCQ